MSCAALLRAVRLTARASGLLFAAAQITAALGRPAMRASRPLYHAFMAVHAAHFTAVARYAVVSGGRNLFPGGRNMADVGGWPTVVAIYSFFAALALTGRAYAAPSTTDTRPAGIASRLATGFIGAMFVGTYLGQRTRSSGYVVLATVIGSAVAANQLSRRRTAQGGSADRGRLVHRKSHLEPRIAWFGDHP
jgi:hypothetical protein